MAEYSHKLYTEISEIHNYLNESFAQTSRRGIILGWESIQSTVNIIDKILLQDIPLLDAQANQTQSNLYEKLNAP